VGSWPVMVVSSSAAGHRNVSPPRWSSAGEALRPLQAPSELPAAALRKSRCCQHGRSLSRCRHRGRQPATTLALPAGGNRIRGEAHARRAHCCDPGRSPRRQPRPSVPSDAVRPSQVPHSSRPAQARGHGRPASPPAGVRGPGLQGRMREALLRADREGECGTRTARRTMPRSVASVRVAPSRSQVSGR
jgi:hypothetical protein